MTPTKSIFLFASERVAIGFNAGFHGDAMVGGCGPETWESVVRERERER